MKKQRFDTCIIDTSSKVSNQPPRKVFFRDELSSMDEPSMMLSIPHSSDLDSTILTAIDRSDIISLGALMYGVSQQKKKEPENKKFKPTMFIEPEKSIVIQCDDTTPPQQHDLHDICSMEPHTLKQEHKQLECIHEDGYEQNKSEYSSESTNEPTSIVFSASTIGENDGNNDCQTEIAPHRSGAFIQDIYRIVSDTQSLY
jgi:hypothetical protein